MLKKIVSKNISDTEKIAKEFLKTLNFQGPRISSQKLGQTVENPKFSKLATIITLSGDLGAGKTTFTQAFGKHLGIKKKINSPTFVIMKKYSIASGEHNFLFHLDAYRLKNEKELEKLGWAEIISDPKNLILIEWPENVAKSIPKKHISIKIAHIKDGERKFEIKHK